MRALGDPDVFPATDRGVRAAAGRLDLPTTPAALRDRALLAPVACLRRAAPVGRLDHPINHWPPEEQPWPSPDAAPSRAPIGPLTLAGGDGVPDRPADGRPAPPAPRRDAWRDDRRRSPTSSNSSTPARRRTRQRPQPDRHHRPLPPSSRRERSPHRLRRRTATQTDAAPTRTRPPHPQPRPPRLAGVVARTGPALPAGRCGVAGRSIAHSWLPARLDSACVGRALVGSVSEVALSGSKLRQ